jgi:hypothetical protein
MAGDHQRSTVRIAVTSRLPECFILARRQSAMCRWAVRGTSSRQQNRHRRADRPLVREQDVVGTAALAEMLVDVYNRLA